MDECFQCKLCYVMCPYIPELHEWALDFPRLMLRADAMRRANGQVSARDKATTGDHGSHRCHRHGCHDAGNRRGDERRDGL